MQDLSLRNKDSGFRIQGLRVLDQGSGFSGFTCTWRGGGLVK